MIFEILYLMQYLFLLLNNVADILILYKIYNISVKALDKLGK